MSAPVHLFQTADAERYFGMLSVTLPANRAFCLRHGVRLEAFLGIRRGVHPWHASYNRLGFLRDRLAEDYRGWAIHLDADAFVADIGFDIHGYLARHGGTGMIHGPGAGAGRWDVNSGVFLWNLAHPAAQEAAKRWIAAFDGIPGAALQAATDWDDVTNDQNLLHEVLRDDPALQAAIHIEDPELLGYQQSRFIKQYVRNAVHTPEQRLARVAREVALAMRRAGEAPRLDGAGVVRAYEFLTGAPPPTLDAAFEALEAGSLSALRDQLLDRG
jgi:hypothetical protein